MSGIDVYEMIPAESRTFWPLFAGLIAVVIVLGGVFAYLSYASKNVRFEVSAEGVHVRGSLFGRLVPASALDTEGAVALDLASAPAFRPTSRRLASALPGYRAGWFTLQSGMRALLFVTDPSSVVYVPTTEGYALMMSVDDPHAMIDSLMKVAPPRHDTFNPPR